MQDRKNTKIINAYCFNVNITNSLLLINITDRVGSPLEKIIV